MKYINKALNRIKERLTLSKCSKSIRFSVFPLHVMRLSYIIKRLITVEQQLYNGTGGPILDQRKN